MRKLALVMITLLVTSFTNADNHKKSGLDLLSDSVLIAKADSMNLEMSNVEVEKNPYTVQLASYVSEQDAIQHVAQVRKFDKTAFYFPTFTRGQVWYKVCAGRFGNMETAEGHRKTLVKKYDSAFAVVISLQSSGTEKRGVASEKPEMSVKLMKASKAHADTPADTPKVAMVNTTSEKEEAVKPAEKANTVVTSEDFQYTLQVASYPTKTDADHRSEALASEGEVHVAESQVSGKTWYRVYVGKFETKREAEAFRAVFAEKTGDKNSFVKRLEK